MTVCAAVQLFCGRFTGGDVARVPENFKWIKWPTESVMGDGPFLPIGFCNLNGGERRMDAKEIEEFKKASPENKLIVIMDGCSGNRPMQYMAIWLADLEKRLTK